jgi:hypothetical protein
MFQALWCVACDTVSLGGKFLIFSTIIGHFLTPKVKSTTVLCSPMILSHTSVTLL